MKTILIFLALAVPVLAHLDETMDQCSARYGQADPVGKDPAIRWFSKNGIEVCCSFYPGANGIPVVGQIQYQKPKGDHLFHPEFSEVEIETLLAANSPGSWKRLRDLPFKKEWNHEQPDISATYDGMDHVLIVASIPYLNWVASKDKAQAKEKLGGF